MSHEESPRHVWVKTILIVVNLAAWPYALRYSHPAELHVLAGAAVGLFVGLGLSRLYGMAFVDGEHATIEWLREKHWRKGLVALWTAGILAAGALALYPALTPEPDPEGDMKLEDLTGTQLMSAGFYDEAVAAFHREMSDAEAPQHAWFGLSQAYMKLGRFDDAEDAALKGIDVSKSSGDGYFHLARARLALDKLDDASAAIREGTRLAPRNLALKDVEATILVKKGDLAAADEIYRKMCQDDPDNPVWALRRSRVLFGRDEFGESRKVLDAAVARARTLAGKSDEGASNLRIAMEMARDLNTQLDRKGFPTLLEDMPAAGNEGPEAPPAPDAELDREPR